VISLQKLKSNTQLWFTPKFPYQKLDKKKMLKFQLALKIELYI